MTNSKINLVIDTSTLISAALRTQSLPAQVFELALEQCSLFASEYTLNELARVLMSAKFDRYLSLAERECFLEQYAASVLMVNPTIAVTDCRDKKDNPFLELALESKSRYIVSSDDDLLALDPWRSVHILKPKDFMSVVLEDSI